MHESYHESHPERVHVSGQIDALVMAIMSFCIGCISKFCSYTLP